MDSSDTLRLLFLSWRTVLRKINSFGQFLPTCRWILMLLKGSLDDVPTDTPEINGRGEVPNRAFG